MNELKVQDITTEQYREYDFGGRVYIIDSPKTLFFRPGGSTHRVLDGHGVVHCLPAPGFNGCAIRWVNKNPEVPVNF